MIDMYHKPTYPPKPTPRRTPKAMTIAAGFKCRDGVLLCADSQITSDQGKTYQAKIFGINKPAGVYLPTAVLFFLPKSWWMSYGNR